jgi:hypothetical protein
MEIDNGSGMRHESQDLNFAWTNPHPRIENLPRTGRIRSPLEGGIQGGCFLVVVSFPRSGWELSRTLQRPNQEGE